MTPQEPSHIKTRVTMRAFAHRLRVAQVAPAMVLFGIGLGLLWVLLISAPRDFNAPRVVRIEEGMGLRGAASLLKEEGVVRHESTFLFGALLWGGEGSLIAGDYYFAGPQTALRVAKRMTMGDYELSQVKVTIPEGATIREMAAILADKLEYFDTETFLALAEGKEGYLFPDTYYFLPTTQSENIIKAMEETFYRRIEELAPAISASGRSLHDIVTMASLLEEEARTDTTRRMISGILWKRIEIGMRLQVDAVFPYIIGKNTFEVTLKDLAVDSPYNTYRYAGLPLGPISNPGISSITAALTPTKSSYLYYLADMQGITHYSRTYAEHLRKQKQYLGS